MATIVRFFVPLAFVVGSCATTPIDTDGDPASASSLPLGRVWEDSLNCSEGDCEDWFRIEIAERGRLRVRSRSASDSAPYAVELVRGPGEPVASRRGSGSHDLERMIEPGQYLVRVASSAATDGDLPYQLVAAWRMPPRPPAPPKPVVPEPQFETRAGEVLELEGAVGAPDYVLFSLGRGDSMKNGLAGRLVQSGRPIARVRVIEVFNDGSRARIEGSLAEPITPDTVVEIDVPSD